MLSPSAEAFSVLRTSGETPPEILPIAQVHPYGAGGFRREGGEIVCDNVTNRTAVAGASWLLRLEQKRPLPVVVSAESRVETEGVSGEHSLYLKIIGVCPRQNHWGLSPPKSLGSVPAKIKSLGSVPVGVSPVKTLPECELS